MVSWTEQESQEEKMQAGNRMKWWQINLLYIEFEIEM